MIFFPILLSLSFSVQRLCLCQPDSTENSCSLQKKCHRFSSDLDIIVYNPQKKMNDYFVSMDANQMKQSYDFAVEKQFPNELFFEVFGSTDTNKNKSPILIDLSEKVFSNLQKLTVYGGEFNQILRIANVNNRSISLEAKNMKIIYENEHEIRFSTLRLQHSYLSLSKQYSTTSNQQSIIATANKVIGDTYSLSSNSFSLIKTSSIEVIDKKEIPCKLCNEFGITAPIKLIEHSKTLPSGSLLEDVQEEQLTSNFQSYSFCVATKNRLKRAIEQLECNAYSVPVSNYIIGQDKDLIQNLQNVPNNTVLRFYVTLSTEADPIAFNFAQFHNNNITIYFRATNLDENTRVEIRGATMPDSIEDKNITLFVSKLKYFSVQSSYLHQMNNFIVQQTPIYITDPADYTSINNVKSDTISLSYFTNTVFNITQNLILSKATVINLQEIRLLLMENCTLTIDQFSNFPITRYNIENDLYCLTLSDIYEEKLLNIYFAGAIVVNYRDDSLNQTSLPELTFSSGTSITQIPESFPYVNITIIVPTQGLSAIFGTGSNKEKPFPNSTVFTFQASNDPNIFEELPEGITPLTLNLTMNDFIDPDENYRLVLYRNFDLNVMTSKSFESYTDGINKRYSGKEDICRGIYNGEIPYFLKVDEEGNCSCYSIAGYNLTKISADVQSELQGIMFNKSAIILNISGKWSKFPDLSKDLFITMNSEHEIAVTMTNETTNEKFHSLTLIIQCDSSFTFDDTFLKLGDKNMFISPSVRRFRLLHGTRAINLTSTSGNPVPFVELDDPVINVTYLTPKLAEKYQISKIANDTFSGQNNTRIGPEINVTLESDGIIFPQNAFLGSSVSFSKGAGQKMTFVYFGEAVAQYTFKDIEVDFISSDQWADKDAVFLEDSEASIAASNNNVNLKANSINLEGSKVNQNQDTPLNLEVNDLSTDDVGASLPASSFASPIKVNNNAQVTPRDNDPIAQIIFGQDSVQVVTNSGKSAVLQQNNPDSTQLNIETSQTQPITLSVEPGAKSVAQNTNMNFNGDEITLNYDKSWNNVYIPPSFAANVKENAAVTVNSETLHAPNVTINGASNIVTITHSQKYTNTLGFIIFIAICGAIFVISIILCIVRLTCCRYREVYDVSTDVEDDEYVTQQEEEDGIIIEEEESDETYDPQQDDSPEFPEDYYENPAQTYPKFEVKNNDYVMDNPPRALRPSKDEKTKSDSPPASSVAQTNDKNQLLNPDEKEPNNVVSDDEANSDVELDSLSDNQQKPNEPARVVPKIVNKISDSSYSEENESNSEAKPSKNSSKVRFATEPLLEKHPEDDKNNSEDEDSQDHESDE